MNFSCIKNAINRETPAIKTFTQNAIVKLKLSARYPVIVVEKLPTPKAEKNMIP